MTLIRHNVRTGSNQSAHFAHDTERPDINGCYVSGRQDRVITSQYRPCPQCGGYGALVPIRPLPRNDYPAGSTVPDRYRLHRATETQPVPQPQPFIEDVPVTPADVAESPGSVTNVPPVTGTADEQAAKDMASAMLAALVPEAASIREAIRAAVEQADSDARDRNNEALTEAIETLTSNYEETVRKLIVPTTIEIKRPDTTEAVPIAGTVHEVFQEVLDTLMSRDHENRPRNVYLTGPAGCGKTTLAKQLAQALDVSYLTTGQVISEHQVMGYEDAGGRYHSTAFRHAFQNGGLWLGDEMDSWSPEATLAANGALANGHATFPDSPEGLDASSNFYCIAAANTWGNGADREYVGRNEMDTSTLSRFVTIPMDFDKALETAISAQWTKWRDLVWLVRERSRELHIRMLAGTREMVHGVAMLNNGIDPERVALRVLRRNMTDAEWSKVSA